MWREAVFLAFIVAAGAIDDRTWRHNTNSFQNEPARSGVGVCLREGAKLVGSEPLQAGPNLRVPAKIRDVRPIYPDLPQGTAITRGLWVGEFLIDLHGKVARVWPIREVKTTPPFPKFNDAIVDAVRQWRYTPLMIDSKATAVCVGVTVMIDLR